MTKLNRWKMWSVMLAFYAVTMMSANAQTYSVVCICDVAGFPEILAQGQDGNLYGTAGGGTSGDGVVFSLSTTGQFTVLHNFSGSDGSGPRSGLTLGSDGNFYGATERGGLNERYCNGCGTLFKISPNGNLTTLHYFNGQDGAYPYAPPVEGRDGNFYGMTSSDNRDNGTTYRISSSGAFTLLGKFPSGGGFAPFVEASDGGLYGTAPFEPGIVFKMTPKGIVSRFSFDWTDGSEPWGPVALGSNGYVYGTTELGGLYGGTYGVGVIYELTSRSAITVLHDFGDPNYPNDGQSSTAGLLYATDGNFYGVTAGGGTQNRGTIFQITPNGEYSILYNFGIDGSWPGATPMQHTNGKIYGVAYEAVYSLDMGLAPFVAFVRPAGKVGQTGGILGQGFTGTTNVSFNGISANFNVVSDTYLTATVPSGATTGYVTVTTPTGVLTSNVPFRVIQ